MDTKPCHRECGRSRSAPPLPPTCVTKHRLVDKSNPEDSQPPSVLGAADRSLPSFSCDFRRSWRGVAKKSFSQLIPAGMREAKGKLLKKPRRWRLTDGFSGPSKLVVERISGRNRARESRQAGRRRDVTKPGSVKGGPLPKLPDSCDVTPYCGHTMAPVGTRCPAGSRYVTLDRSAWH
jgi:hypothetical protein